MKHETVMDMTVAMPNLRVLGVCVYSVYRGLNNYGRVLGFIGRALGARLRLRTYRGPENAPCLQFCDPPPDRCQTSGLAAAMQLNP